MIKVGIIGASGMAGSAIYDLTSQQENLDVTGIVRNKEKAEKVLGKNANLLIGDVLTMSASLLEKFDVIVDAFGTVPEYAAQQVELAKKLIDIARKNTNHKTRVIFVLGAGSLHTGNDDHLVVEDIEKMDGSDAWINTPRQQLKELEYLQAVNDVDWLGISPSMVFEAGPATAFELGGDNLLYNEKHESKVTTGSMARLVLNEILNPKYHNQRITIVNK